MISIETWALFSSSNGFKISPHTSLSRDSSVPKGGIQSTSFVFSPLAFSPSVLLSAAACSLTGVPPVSLPPADAASFCPLAPHPVASIPAITPASARLRHFFILFFIVFASFSNRFDDGPIITPKIPPVYFLFLCCFSNSQMLYIEISRHCDIHFFH